MKDKAHAALLWLWKTLPIPRGARYWLLWLGNTKFLVGVVGVVFDDRERVLVLRHTYRRRYPWGLPGGWVDGRERLELGLARELREETGMAIAIGEVFHVRSGYRRPQVDVHYLCTYEGGHFRANAEIAEARFCALDALPEGCSPGKGRYWSGHCCCIAGDGHTVRRRMESEEVRRECR